MQPRSVEVQTEHVQTLSAGFLHVRAAFTAEPDLVHMPLYKAEYLTHMRPYKAGCCHPYKAV